jgi:hypothetical protein
MACSMLGWDGRYKSYRRVVRPVLGGFQFKVPQVGFFFRGALVYFTRVECLVFMSPVCSCSSALWGMHLEGKLII